MRTINTEELKEYQLRILDKVAAFCEEQGITYWIDSGTLLGAIRHKGYIPWDDDIDLGMLREDYDRFCKTFNQHNDRYKVVCVENDPDFYLSHAKVCDNSTVLYEPDENGFKLMINIDIFVYDNAPDDDEKVKKMYDKRDFWRKAHAIQNTPVPAGNPVVSLVKHVRKFIYKVCFSNRCIKNMVKNSKKYANVETARVGNFTAFTRMSCNKRVFEKFVPVVFEGKEYMAPIGYDEWLRSFYGDYMKLPPEEKRVSHHSFVAYVED